MMTETLRSAATLKGLALLIGDRKDFSIDVDKLDPHQSVLFHEGYINAGITIDMQGAFEPGYNLTLHILQPSQDTRNPQEKEPFVGQAEQWAYELLDYLSKQFEIKGITIRENVTFPSSRNLTGVTLTCNAKAKSAILICS